MPADDPTTDALRKVVTDSAPTIYKALDVRVAEIKTKTGSIGKQVEAVSRLIETRLSMLANVKLEKGDEARWLSLLRSALQVAAEDRGRGSNPLIREHLNETISRALQGALHASMK